MSTHLAAGSQGVPKLSCQRLLSIGFAEEINAFVKPASMNDCIFGIARGKEDDYVRNLSRAFLASSGAS